MSAGWQRNGELWVLMQARRLGFGWNPLRRRIDRIESMIVLGAVLAGLLIVPGSAALGTAARNASEQSAAQRRAALTQVMARTLDDAQTAIPQVPGSYVSQVRVGWTDPAGWPREGRTTASAGTKKGTELTIWLDASGAIVTPPRGAGDSNAIGSAVGLSAAMVAWLLILGLTRLFLVPLNRRRSRDWEREWAQVAPRWRHPQN